MFRKDIVLYQNKETRASLCPYESHKEMDKVYWKAVDKLSAMDINTRLKNALKRLLEHIVRISVKECVCYQSQAEMAVKLKYKDRRSVHNHLKMLVEFGILLKYPTRRESDDKQSTDIIIINPACGQVVENAPVVEEVSAPVEEVETVEFTLEEEVKFTLENEQNSHQESFSLSSSLESLNNKKRKEYVSSKDIVLELEDELDASLTPDFIGQDFKQAVASCFPNAKTIYTLWGKAVKVSSEFGLTFVHEPFAVKAFKDSIIASKLGMIKKGNTLDAITGYFFGALRNIYRDAQQGYEAERRRELEEKSALHLALDASFGI